MTETNQQNQVPFIARSTATNERVEATSANEVVEFYRRQNRLTGTDVEWIFCDHPAVAQAPDSGDIEGVLGELEEVFKGGIPLGIITAVMSKQGWTVGQSLDALYTLRMAGELWEPRDNHLRPV